MQAPLALPTKKTEGADEHIHDHRPRHGTFRLHPLQRHEKGPSDKQRAGAVQSAVRADNPVPSHLGSAPVAGRRWR